MKADELYCHGMQNKVLKTCQEGQLLFDPTYKYDQGMTEYDTGPKKRIPAWTDRVLFSQQNSQSMTLIKYGRAEVTLSDHRPIYAHFRVKVNRINQEARSIAEQNLISRFNAIKTNERTQKEKEKQIKQRSEADAGAGISDADFTAAAQD